MLVVENDRVDAEALEARVAGAADVVGAAADGALGRVVPIAHEAELGREDHARAAAGDRAESTELARLHLPPGAQYPSVTATRPASPSWPAVDGGDVLDDKAEMETRDIGVVGAGFAGMAAALFLEQDGHRVTLYERAAAPGPVGAAIVLQPSGMAVLRHLGLDQTVEAASARIDRLRVATARGKTIVALDYRSLNAAWYGLGVGRGVLFEALWRAVAARPITVRVGAEVHGRVAVAGGTARGVSGGTDKWQLVLADGSQSGPHDLIVAADGVRSRLADTIPGRTVKPYAWGALFFVGPAPDSHEVHQVADGARRFMGVLPMGHGRASLFWSLRADRVAAWRQGFGAWRDEALALGPHARSLIEAIGGPDDVLFAPYHDVRMKRWFAPGCVAIGDAAHATSPQLGQGSNLALWDALVLAESLRQAPDVPAALGRYAATRRRHLAYYQRATRWLTPFFQGDSRVLGWLRDVGMPIGMRIGPVRRLMTRSMAGVAAGFGGRSEALPGPGPTET